MNKSIIAILILCLSLTAYCAETEIDSNNKISVLFPVSLRDKPSMYSEDIEALKPGEELIDLGREGYWYKVKTESGNIGYAAINWINNEQGSRTNS